MDTTQQASRALVETGGVRGWIQRTVAFLGAVQLEMKKVSWPSRDELTKATRMILIMSILLGVLIGWLDLLLQLILVDGVARLAR
jgi:preprotein translocase SecE subunit